MSLCITAISQQTKLFQAVKYISTDASPKKKPSLPYSVVLFALPSSTMVDVAMMRRG